MFKWIKGLKRKVVPELKCSDGHTMVELMKWKPNKLVIYECIKCGERHYDGEYGDGFKKKQ